MLRQHEGSSIMFLYSKLIFFKVWNESNLGAGSFRLFPCINKNKNLFGRSTARQGSFDERLEIRQTVVGKAKNLQNKFPNFSHHCWICFLLHPVEGVNCVTQKKIDCSMLTLFQFAIKRYSVESSSVRKLVWRRFKQMWRLGRLQLACFHSMVKQMAFCCVQPVTMRTMRLTSAQSASWLFERSVSLICVRLKVAQDFTISFGGLRDQTLQNLDGKEVPWKGLPGYPTADVLK